MPDDKDQPKPRLPYRAPYPTGTYAHRTLRKATGISADPRVPSRTGLTGLANWLMSLATGYPVYPEQEAGPVDMLLAAAPVVGKLKSLKALAKGAKEVTAAEEAVQGIRAYHGSPHDFERFSAEKIGTGEGAQAYGHGLYFAEKEGTAKAYREKLATGKVELYGQEYPVPAWRGDMDPHTRLVRRLADNRAGRAGVPETDIIALTRQQIEEGLTNPFADRTALQKELEHLDRAMTHPAGIKTDPGGKMYEVNINADPAHFLDWDAPLHEQSPQVQEALAKHGIKPPDPALIHEADMIRADATHRYAQAQANKADDATLQRLRAEMNAAERDYATLSAGEWMTGEHMYRDVGGRSDVAASQRLREAGIPGLKYYDQGSRASAGGELIDVSKTPEGWRAKIRVGNRSVGFQNAPTTAWTISTPYKTEAEARAWAAQKIGGGTRNLVVFPGKEDLIDILRKYGWLPPVAGMGYLSQVGEPKPRGPS